MTEILKCKRLHDMLTKIQVWLKHCTQFDVVTRKNVAWLQFFLLKILGFEHLRKA